MATIVARRPHPKGEVHYYYHSARREKLSPSDRGRRGPGSGASRVVSHDVHLGTAEAVLRAIQQGPLQVAPRAFGLVMAAYGLVQELGVAEAVNSALPTQRRGLSVGQYLALAVVAKVSAPRVSWRGFGAWLSKTALAEHLALPKGLLDAQNFWDAFDRVLPEHDHHADPAGQGVREAERVLAIQRAIWRNVLRLQPVALDTLLYDNTNFFSYLAGETPATLAQPGHNKAGRHEKRQVGLALAVTQRFALPLLHLTYAGNRADSMVFPEVLTSLVEHTRELAASAEHLLLVFDRGQNSKANLQAANEAKVHVVGGLIASQQRELLTIPLVQFTEQAGDLRIHRTERQVYGLPAVVIITFNPKLHYKQRRSFDRGLRRLSAALWKTYHQHQGLPPARRRKALQRTHTRSRLRRYLQWTLDEHGRLRLHQQAEACARKRAEFGKRLLFTTRTTLTTEQILDLYNRDKVEVEKDFHYLKAPDLVRFQPMRHFTDTKIRLYALVCVLGLLVLKLMELRAEPLGLSLDALLSELEDIQEVILVYSPRRAQRTLSHPSTIQRRLIDLFGLARFAPVPPAPAD